MSFFKFLFSKAFLIQVVLAILVAAILIFLAMQWLKVETNHDERLQVPDLSKLSLSAVDQKLDKLDLRRTILDSANYNPDYPKYSVIEQTPPAGSYVKEKRKIYLKLNPSGYAKIEIPNLIRRTKRQVEPTLRSMGFKIGEITYKPDIAKNALLEMHSEGKKIEPGDSLMKTAVIDLVLGDGSTDYNSAN